MAKRDYYEILGIPRTATAEDIKKAHRKLVRQHHPDVNKNNKASEEKFKEAQEAYDVLSDPPSCANYDQFGHAGVGAEPGRGGDAYEAFRRAQAGRGRTRQWQAGPNVEVEDFDFGGQGGGDFSSIFDQLFGRGGGGASPQSRGRARPEPQRGADVEHVVPLTFQQAARGTTLPLQINREGKIETIEIKIPAGVSDGSRIRIKGRGQQSHTGDHGDLYIITRVQPHEYFRREGLDLYLDLPISIYESIFGAKIEVPTLDGPVQLTIPPGTNSGAKLRIKGRGIERGAEKGDEFVVTKIIVPKDLDETDKDLIRQIAMKHPIEARADVRW